MADFKVAYGDCNLDEMASCSLWYSDYSKFHKNRIKSWHGKGLRFLNYLLNTNICICSLMSFVEAKLRYKIVVQFDYDSLVSSLPRSWRAADKIKLLRPVIDPSLSFIQKNQDNLIIGYPITCRNTMAKSENRL